MNSGIPKGATHYLPMKDGVTPQLFYRLGSHTFPDGEVRTTLAYRSFCDLWQGSCERDVEGFVRDRLVKL